MRPIPPDALLKPRVQIALHGPPAPDETKCKGCGKMHPTKFQIDCECGQTIYVPFSEVL